MKKILRPGDSRIYRKDSWKESWYAFVPYQTHFGELCGFADDIVAGGQGFGMHPHRNMEISTIVLYGAQRHEDNTGKSGIIGADSVQTMSAGTGIMHSEFNASQTEPFRSYQIWVYPKQQQVAPRHEQFTYRPEEKRNKVLLALSPDGREHTAAINQDAFFSVAAMDAGQQINYAMHLPANGVYVHCAGGEVLIDGDTLRAGDAIGIYEASGFSISCTSTAELIFVEVPMERGVKLQ